MVPPFLFFLATAASVKSDAPLRTGCSDDDPVVAQLQAGQAVSVRFSIAGGAPCYKVAATVDGKEIQGYLPAANLTGLDQFDQARRAAAGLDHASAVRQDAAAIQKTAAARVGSQHPAAKAVAFLDANQPAEALQVIEKLLTIQKNDPALLALAGLAYYRSDNLQQARIYWKESLDLQPDPAVERMYRKLEQEMAADKGSDRTVGNRVLLRYERGAVDPATARRMLDILDTEYSRLSAQFGCQAPEKVTAIVQSPSTYYASTGAREWSGGQYDGRVHIPLADARIPSSQLRRTFTHELVHACLSEIGHWPGWIQEGLAQKFSGDTLSAPAKAEIAKLAQAKALPKLDAMGGTFSQMSAVNAKIAYQVALAAAEELVSVTQNVGLPNVLRNPSLLDSATHEVEKRLGL